MSILRETDLKIDDFVGLDNVSEPSISPISALQTADNVVITSDKLVRRRDGYATRLSASSTHSVWSDGDICLFCTGTTLVRLHDNLTSTTVLRSDITSSKRMTYLGLNGRVYYSNGLESGVIENYTDRTWGLSIPPKPTLSTTVGSLLTGRYQVVLTYIRNDGQESGSSDLSFIDITTDNSGIIATIIASSDPTVSYINVFGTSTNGEIYWYLGTVSNSNTTFTIQDPTQYSNVQIKTEGLDKPPTGYLIEYYNGRLYIVDGSIVWYTEPYGYELINMADNYLMFSSPVTMISAVQDGLWVATQDETFFLAGPDVPFQKVNKDNAGVIFGTSVKLDGANFGEEKTYTGPVVLWASVKYGFCAGMNGGQLVYSTVKKFCFPSTYTEGSGIVKIEDDGVQYIVSLT